MRSTRLHFQAAPLLLALLAACGGGGGGASEAPGNDAGMSAGRVSSNQPGEQSVSQGTGAQLTGNSTDGIGAGPQQGNAHLSANTSSTGEQHSLNNTVDANAFFSKVVHATGCPITYQPRFLNPRLGPDPRLKDQWFLKNTGHVFNDGHHFTTTTGIDLNLESVWKAGYRGEGIRVAVLDDGLELTHDDLIENVLPGASFNFIGFDPSGKKQHKPGYGSAWPMPCTADDNHGTNVAGVIAARSNNAVGGSGVAPRASLIGLNVLQSSYGTNILKAFSWQSDTTAIYNISWGALDNGKFHLDPLEKEISNLIHEQLDKGRNGLGSIFVFAAGNGGVVADYSPYEARVSQLGAIAVCGVNAVGKRSGFSEPGPNLLVCGPSGDSGWTDEFFKPGIVTTDIITSPAADKHAEKFSGTSAAAPMVSGVIALMLQANPQLTWRDVRLILARSARKVQPESPNWTTYSGLNFNHEFGFGLADAKKAVELAKTWKSVGGSSSLKQCGPYELSADQQNRAIPEVSLLSPDQIEVEEELVVKPWKGLNFNLPAPNGTQTRIPVDANCDIRHIEHVDVHLTATPDQGGDDNNGLGNLHLSLTSPSGQTSTLTLAHQCVNADYDKGSNKTTYTPAVCGELNNFRFGLSRHLEEPPIHNGNRHWTLTAADRVAGKTSTLKTWKITLHGR
ncbi:MAG: S8 family serine peptidase [Lautropia sp.]|nr:S8 family serine peptidase [Lautropia sp.]